MFLIDLLRPVTVRSLMGTFAGFKHARLSIHQATRMSTVLRQDRRSPQPALNIAGLGPQGPQSWREATAARANTGGRGLANRPDELIIVLGDVQSRQSARWGHEHRVS